MKFYIDEIERWEQDNDPIYKKAQNLKKVRKELANDDWAIHWFIDHGFCGR
jgi:hypothetical protein